MSKQIFQTLHLEIEKDIDQNDINDDIFDILSKHGYNCVGHIGTTPFEINEKTKYPITIAREAFQKHYFDIKGAW